MRAQQRTMRNTFVRIESSALLITIRDPRYPIIATSIARTILHTDIYYIHKYSLLSRMHHTFSGFHRSRCCETGQERNSQRVRPYGTTDLEFITFVSCPNSMNKGQGLHDEGDTENRRLVQPCASHQFRHPAASRHQLERSGRRGGVSAIGARCDSSNCPMVCLSPSPSWMEQFIEGYPSFPIHVHGGRKR